MPRLAVLLLAALTVSACDTEAPDRVTFQGVDVDVRGDASLSVSGGELVVSGLNGTRSGGFTLTNKPDQVDVEIAPLTIPTGGRFGVEVRDGDALVASLYNEATAPGEFDVLFDFPDALGVTLAIVRYRLKDELVFEAEVELIPGRSRGQRQPTSGGSGEGASGSTHVIRERGRYVVVSDSGGESRRADGCPGFLMTPPLPYAQTVICADWIEVEPLVTAPVPQGDVAVTARGVGSFRVRSLQVK